MSMFNNAYVQGVNPRTLDLFAQAANEPHAISLTKTQWFDIYSLLENHADDLRNLATYCYDNAVARAYMIAKADEAAELADEINRGMSFGKVTS